MKVPSDYGSSPSAWMPLGEASLRVFYERIDGRVGLLAVIINGMAISPDDYLPDHVTDGWIEEFERAGRERMEAS